MPYSEMLSLSRTNTVPNEALVRQQSGNMAFPMEIYILDARVIGSKKLQLIECQQAMVEYLDPKQKSTY
jgi:hypothetical protein